MDSTTLRPHRSSFQTKAAFVFAHDWMYRMHDRWFKLSVETFDAIHYAGLAVYKVGILLLNLVPLVALYLIS